MTEELNVNTKRIKKMNFEIPGKISLQLEDGRTIIVPLKYFPELQKMPVEKREKCTIVDDNILLFPYADSVYHLDDFMTLEEKWKNR